MDRSAKRLHRDRLTVDDECQARRQRESAQPAENLLRVGMRRHGFDERDLGADGNDLAMNLDGGTAVDELAPARAFGLVADEQHRVACVGQRGAEMVENTPTGGHAACRNHNGRHLGLRQLFRLGGRGDGAKSLGAERADLALVYRVLFPLTESLFVVRWPVRSFFVARLRLQLRIELRQPLLITRERFDRHGAVNEYRQHRDSFRLFESLQPVDQLFHPADGKRWNDNPSPARSRSGDDLRQLSTVVVLMMDAIAVGRFNEQVIGLAHGGWIGKDWTAESAEITTEQNRHATGADSRVR